MDRRVVVTGIGVVSSLGIGKEQFWPGLCAGITGISPVTCINTRDFPTHNAGEVKNFHPENKKIGRASSFAVKAAALAIKDSGLRPWQLDKERTGVALGTTMGESPILEKINDARLKRGPEYIDANTICQLPAYVIPTQVALALKLRGPNYIIPTACAAGNYCIGYAFDLIRTGVSDFMLCGGSDAFSRIAFMGFNRMFAVAPDVCQPFDKNRQGMMVGEGAGILLLETRENALKRKADIYAEVLGYGLSCDAQHMTVPHSDGIADAIVKALRYSGIAPQEVDYINAHGTGTPANDREESLAIKKVFPENYRKVAVTSIKSMLGHTMGAASAIEAISCCLTLKDDIIPPTINYQTPDPECDVDVVANTSRKVKVNIALNNSSAFGGNNACVVFRKHLP